MRTSIVHVYLYGLIKREVNGKNSIHISRIHPIIKLAIRLPRKYQTEIIKELVELELLKKIDRDNYELIGRIKNPPYDSLGEPLW